MAYNVDIDHEDMVHTERNKSGILYRNFSGRPNNFGNTNKTFTINLKEDKALDLERQGFKIRKRLNYDEQEEFLLDIDIRFDLEFFPVHIYQITEHGKTLLNEEMAKDLDSAEIQFADLRIRPYRWTRPGGISGVKAQLVDGYFVIAEDKFASRYNFD